MISYFIVLLVMTILGSVASVFLKRASGAETFMSLIKNVNLYVGGFLYLASAILNIWILRYLDYSVVLPLTALTYIWTMILSYVFFSEKMTKSKRFGVLLILIGAVCVSI